MTIPFAGTLKVVASGDQDIVMTRDFEAPRPLVFDAFTKPELVRKWLLGPPGWTMPVCEIDLKVGGRYRYAWTKESTGTSMGVSGVFREVSPPARVVHTERFDESWYPGEALITSEFVETPAGTSVTMTMHMVSREARDGVLKSGMESGVAASYDRLAEILDTPQILRTAARPIATIHVTVPRSDMMKVMGPGFQELMAAVAAQGIATAGPWFTHHLRMDPAVFDFEIGVPVSAPVSPAGRVKPGTWPAAKVARTVYRGPYEGLGAAWGEFEKWIKAEGHTSAPDLWERYVTGPESGPDGATYRTELSRPLVG